MANFPTFVANAQEDLTRLDENAPTTPADEIHRRNTNFKEWLLSFQSAKDPKQKKILMDELKSGGGVDFPFVKGIHTPHDDADSMDFAVLGKSGAQPAASTSDEMQFHILGRTKDAGNVETQQTPLIREGERADTPGGALTGITRVPPARNDIRGAGSPDQGSAFRLGAETGGSFLGGSVGALLGGAGGAAASRGGPGTGIGATAGLRVGEALGAGAGSLLAEVFDPTPEPFHEAAKAAGFTFGTGLIASGLTGGARRLLGKQSEGGQYLMQIMQKSGEVPTPGAVLDSEFVKNTQSFGSAAFGTNELLKEAQSKAEGITSEAARQYVSGFQRYHESASKAFEAVDMALAAPRVPGSTQILANVPGNLAMTAPGSRFWLKGDERARDAMLDVAENWVNRTGRADAMPSGLQKMYAWAKGGPAPVFTFNETQQVYDALYNKARALDRAAKNNDVTELAGTNTAAYVREQAKRVKDAFDTQLDEAINSKAVDPKIKDLLASARGNWKLWSEGQELERMLASSTKDLAGDGTIKGSKLLNELDKIIKEDQKVSNGRRPTLSKDTTEGIRRYAMALKSLEDADKAGGYVFAGRMGQLVGISSMVGGAFGGSAAVTGAGLFMSVAPHVIAWSFSNPKAASLLIRGLRVEPGTASGMRLTRELLSLWEKEGLVGPNYEEGPQELPSTNPGSPKYVPQ